LTSHLVINAALFLSMVFIIHYYICKEPIYRDSPLKSRLILGLCYGFVSGVLMFFRRDLEYGLLDMRHLPLLLTAFYGGLAAAIPAWLIACLARLLLVKQLGDFTMPILILALDAIIGVFVPQLIHNARFKWLITLIVDVAMLSLILPQVLANNGFGYWFVFANIVFFGGLIAYHLTESLRKTQQTLRQLEQSRTELESTVERLDEIKEQLESFITHSVDAIVIFNLEKKVINANPAFEKIFGWTTEEIIGCKTLPWVPPGQKEEYSGLPWIKTSNQSMIGFETTYLRKNGKEITVSASVSTVYNRQGTAIGFSAIYRDITEKKQTEDLLRNSEKLSVVGELAAGIAHEIRNPLTTLKGFIRLMEEEHSTFYFKVMNNELERIESITNEFLFLAKPSATKTRLMPLKDLLEQVITLLTPLATINNSRLILNVDANLPAVTCEENQIKQVFVNLIKNAIESMPNGGNVIITGKQEEKNTLLVTVADQGIGIPDDRISKLGEPFYCLKEKGTGLGLTICKKIIQDHKGEMTFQSKVNEGTIVDVRLPVR